MTQDATGSDQKRIRTALIFLVMGMLLLVFAWGSWVYRTPTPPMAVESTGGPERADAVGGATTSWQWLVAVTVVVLVLLFGGYLLLRLGRPLEGTWGGQETAMSPPGDEPAARRVRRRAGDVEADRGDM